jgi:hydroxylaminobenzene mutase
MSTRGVSNWYRRKGRLKLSVMKGEIAMKTRNRQLMWHGMFLFLLGLLTGFVEQRFTNVRMGLAGHLEGVINGTFLVALGAIWTEVRLPSAAKATAYWTALYGTYMNWVSTILAAVWGTATHQPILAAGGRFIPWSNGFGLILNGQSRIAGGRRRLGYGVSSSRLPGAVPRDMGGNGCKHYGRFGADWLELDRSLIKDVSSAWASPKVRRIDRLCYPKLKLGRA